MHHHSHRVMPFVNLLSALFNTGLEGIVLLLLRTQLFLDVVLLRCKPSLLCLRLMHLRLQHAYWTGLDQINAVPDGPFPVDAVHIYLTHGLICVDLRLHEVLLNFVLEAPVVVRKLLF